MEIYSERETLFIDVHSPYTVVAVTLSPRKMIHPSNSTIDLQFKRLHFQCRGGANVHGVVKGLRGLIMTSGMSIFA